MKIHILMIKAVRSSLPRIVFVYNCVSLNSNEATHTTHNVQHIGFYGPLVYLSYHIVLLYLMNFSLHINILYLFCNN